MNFEGNSVHDVQATFDRNSDRMKARLMSPIISAAKAPRNRRNWTTLTTLAVIKSWRSRLHLRSLFSPFLHVKVFSFATRCTFDATCTSFKVKPLCRRKQRKLPRKLQQKLRLLQQRLRRPRMMKKKSSIFRTLLTKKTTLKAKNLSHEPDLSSS